MLSGGKEDSVNMESHSKGGGEEDVGEGSLEDDYDMLEIYTKGSTEDAPLEEEDEVAEEVIYENIERLRPRKSLEKGSVNISKLLKLEGTEQRSKATQTVKREGDWGEPKNILMNEQIIIVEKQEEEKVRNVRGSWRKNINAVIGIHTERANYYKI